VSVFYVIGEVRAIINSATCILQTSVHGATQLHFLEQLVQDIAAERGQFLSEKRDRQKFVLQPLAVLLLA